MLQSSSSYQVTQNTQVAVVSSPTFVQQTQLQLKWSTFTLEKMNFFNPTNPMYRRSVVLLSTYLCTVTGCHVIMADFGSQEHCFSPVQRYITAKADAFFEITEDDLIEAQRIRKLKKIEMDIINSDLTSRLFRLNKDTQNSEEKKGWYCLLYACAIGDLQSRRFLQSHFYGSAFLNGNELPRFCWCVKHGPISDSLIYRTISVVEESAVYAIKAHQIEWLHYFYSTHMWSPGIPFVYFSLFATIKCSLLNLLCKYCTCSSNRMFLGGRGST